MSKRSQIIDFIGGALMLYLIGLLAIIWGVEAAVRRMVRRRP